MALKSLQYTAEAWGVSVFTVRRLAAAGIVQTVTVGRRRLVPESEVARISLTGTPEIAKRIADVLPKQKRERP